MDAAGSAERHRRARWRRCGAFVILLAAGCAVFVVFAVESSPSSAATIEVRSVAEYPHDPRAFCQGLVVHDAKLLESTGQRSRSTLREVDLETGTVRRMRKLSRDVFGEGLTVWKDQVIQLTWKNGYLIIWDAATLERLGTVAYRRIDRSLKEGWGITHNGRQFIISDGSSVLRFVDPSTWRVVRRLRVHAGLRSVRRLNELEYVDGEVLANVWRSTRIARIDPQTGAVRGWLELKRLVPASVRRSRDAVLNGIAWDADSRRLFITGKYWPTLYEITYDGLSGAE